MYFVEWRRNCRIVEEKKRKIRVVDIFLFFLFLRFCPLRPRVSEDWLICLSSQVARRSFYSGTSYWDHAENLHSSSGEIEEKKKKLKREGDE